MAHSEADVLGNADLMQQYVMRKLTDHRDVLSLQRANKELYLSTRDDAVWLQFLRRHFNLNPRLETCKFRLQAAYGKLHASNRISRLYPVRFFGTFTDGGCDENSGVYWVDHIFCPNHWGAYCSKRLTYTTCVGILQAERVLADTEELRHRSLMIERLRWQWVPGPYAAPLNTILEVAGRRLALQSTHVLERTFRNLYMHYLNGMPDGRVLLMHADQQARNLGLQEGAYDDFMKLEPQVLQRIDAICMRNQQANYAQHVEGFAKDDGMVLYDRRALQLMRDPKTAAQVAIIRRLEVSRVGQYSCPVRVGSVMMGMRRTCRQGECKDSLHAVRQQPGIQALRGITMYSQVVELSENGQLPKIVQHRVEGHAEWVEFAPPVFEDDLNSAGTSAQECADDWITRPLQPVVWFRFLTMEEHEVAHGPLFAVDNDNDDESLDDDDDDDYDEHEDAYDMDDDFQQMASSSDDEGIGMLELVDDGQGSDDAMHESDFGDDTPAGWAPAHQHAYAQMLANPVHFAEEFAHMLNHLQHNLQPPIPLLQPAAQTNAGPSAPFAPSPLHPPPGALASNIHTGPAASPPAAGPPVSHAPEGPSALHSQVNPISLNPTNPNSAILTNSAFANPTNSRVSISPGNSNFPNPENPTFFNSGNPTSATNLASATLAAGSVSTPPGHATNSSPVCIAPAPPSPMVASPLPSGPMPASPMAANPMPTSLAVVSSHPISSSSGEQASPLTSPALASFFAAASQLFSNHLMPAQPNLDNTNLAISNPATPNLSNHSSNNPADSNLPASNPAYSSLPISSPAQTNLPNFSPAQSNLPTSNPYYQSTSIHTEPTSSGLWRIQQHQLQLQRAHANPSNSSTTNTNSSSITASNNSSSHTILNHDSSNNNHNPATGTNNTAAGIQLSNQASGIIHGSTDPIPPVQVSSLSEPSNPPVRLPWPTLDSPHIPPVPQPPPGVPGFDSPDSKSNTEPQGFRGATAGTSINAPARTTSASLSSLANAATSNAARSNPGPSNSGPSNLAPSNPAPSQANPNSQATRTAAILSLLQQVREGVPAQMLACGLGPGAGGNNRYGSQERSGPSGAGASSRGVNATGPSSASRDGNLPGGINASTSTAGAPAACTGAAGGSLGIGGNSQGVGRGGAGNSHITPGSSSAPASITPGSGVSGLGGVALASSSGPSMNTSATADGSSLPLSELADLPPLSRASWRPVTRMREGRGGQDLRGASGSGQAGPSRMSGTSGTAAVGGTEDMDVGDDDRLNEVQVLPPPEPSLRQQQRKPSEVLQLELQNPRAANLVTVQLIDCEDKMSEFDDHHDYPNVDVAWVAFDGVVVQFPPGTELS